MLIEQWVQKGWCCHSVILQQGSIGMGMPGIPRRVHTTAWLPIRNLALLAPHAPRCPFLFSGPPPNLLFEAPDIAVAYISAAKRAGTTNKRTVAVDQKSEPPGDAAMVEGVAAWQLRQLL
jgi:hypothetical protein